MKRGIIITMPEGSRVDEVAKTLSLRGFPSDPDRFEVETHLDFEHDELLVKVRTYHAGERWLPEVRQHEEFTRCTLDRFADMVAGKGEGIGFKS